MGLGKRTGSRAQGRRRPLPRIWMFIQNKRSGGTPYMGTEVSK